MSELLTIILRFRDLVTERDDTIRRHQELGNKPGGGYVWWGWIPDGFRAGEALPCDVR
jgi:hypothetical protein